MIKKIIKKYKNYHPNKWECFLFLIIPFVLGLFVSTRTDDDIWFLLALGKRILSEGFVHIDNFTIHTDLHIIVQQWLIDIVFYKSYMLFGKLGIFIIINLVNIYIIFITYKLLMLVTGNRRNLSVLFTCIIDCLLSMFSIIIARPQIFSTAILITELYFLENYFYTNNKKVLFLLPLLSLLMINLHAAIWPMLICFLGPFILNTFNYKIGKIVSSSREKGPLFLSLVGMVISSFINPYGLEAITYTLNSYGIMEISNLVPEMMPLDISFGYGKMIFILILMIVLFYVVFNKKKIESRYLFFFLGTVYLTLASNRGVVFLIISSIYPISSFVSKYFRIKKEENIHLKTKLQIIFIAFLLIILPLFIIISNDYITLFSTTKQQLNYIADKEKDNKVNIKVYCSYANCTYGDYIGIKTYIDSRAEVFLKVNNKKEDIFSEYYALQKGHLYYLDFIKKYDFDYFIVDYNDYLFRNLLNDSNYEMVYKNEVILENHFKLHTFDDFTVYYVFKRKEG